MQKGFEVFSLDTEEFLVVDQLLLEHILHFHDKIMTVINTYSRQELIYQQNY
jgi:hypothetical protein